MCTCEIIKYCRRAESRFLCVCSLSKSVSVLPLQTLRVLPRGIHLLSKTLGKIVIETLAVLRLDESILNHFFICKSWDVFTNSESFRLMGFEVIEMFEQVVNPDFKDAFDSDEVVWVLLVL